VLEGHVFPLFVQETFVLCDYRHIYNISVTNIKYLTEGLMKLYIGITNYRVICYVCCISFYGCYFSSDMIIPFGQQGYKEKIVSSKF